MDGALPATPFPNSSHFGSAAAARDEEFRKQTDYISIVFIHTESARGRARSSVSTRDDVELVPRTRPFDAEQRTQLQYNSSAVRNASVRPSVLSRGKNRWLENVVNSTTPRS